MNLVKFLKELPEWNELIKLPAKVKQLEKRLEELEKPSSSFDACPACKHKTFKLISSEADEIFGELGATKRTYKCSNCNFQETKLNT